MLAELRHAALAADLEEDVTLNRGFPLATLEHHFQSGCFSADPIVARIPSADLNAVVAQR